MTILEVLFSILITSVGLLGAIALFPVASAQARKARLYDAAAAAAPSAVHMVDTMGMRRPDRWVGYSQQWDAPTSPPQTDGYHPVQNVRFVPGTAFCIDPRTFAANSGDPLHPGVTSGNSALASLFPHVFRTQTAPLAASPRMFRISLLSGSPVAPNSIMSQLQADSVFVFNDDLAFFRPGLDDVSALGLPGFTNDRSLPAVYDFVRYSTHRPIQGRLSWMATLVPKVDIYTAAANPNARGFFASTSDEYLLSIVIFSDRPSDLSATEPLYERVVNCRLESDGSTGGEVLLWWTPGASIQDAEQAKERLKVRSNEWIMLAANQFVAPGFSIPRFQWFRVAEVDDIHWNTDIANSYSRYVTLMGQDWNTDYRPPELPTNTTHRAEATLIEGIVAVYEKTIRLDYGSSF